MKSIFSVCCKALVALVATLSISVSAFAQTVGGKVIDWFDEVRYGDWKQATVNMLHQVFFLMANISAQFLSQRWRLFQDCMFRIATGNNRYLNLILKTMKEAPPIGSASYFIVS